MTTDRDLLDPRICSAMTCSGIGQAETCEQSPTGLASAGLPSLQILARLDGDARARLSP